MRSELTIQLMPKAKVTTEVWAQVETQAPTEEKTEVVTEVETAEETAIHLGFSWKDLAEVSVPQPTGR